MEKNEPELKAYLKVLKRFHDTTNVEGFLKRCRKFYQGALDNVKSHLDESLIPTMETYFEESNPQYNLIIIPFPYWNGFLYKYWN